MFGDNDPIAPSSSPSTCLRYAIHSARAVVQALIARDRDTAEEAALRTCRDCDLLIHLIRDLALMLRDSRIKQLGLSPLETVILARRAEQVLALVEEQEWDDLPLAQSNQLRDPTSQARQPHGQSSAAGIQGDASMISSPTPQGLTVASTGLRVRLTPVDDKASDSPAGDSKGNRHPKRSPGAPDLGPDEG